MKVRNLTIIVEKDRGVFLGLYSNSAIFSKIDPLESTKAYGFKNKDDAKTFIDKYLPHFSETVEYIDIPTDQFIYVDAVDIIKAGFPHYAKDLFINMPTEPTIH